MSLRHQRKYCLANRQGTIGIHTIRDTFDIGSLKNQKTENQRTTSGMAMRNQCENEKVNVSLKASYRVNSYCEVAGTLGRRG